jgi:flavin reductase (DIM6/NTAB) family NADH-FMN oxidoreductase RutF
MTKKTFPLKKVYTLLGSGPVIMVSTRFKGKPNVMTVAWHTMIDFDPPLVGVVIGEQSQTFEVLKATKECVINIPAASLAKKAVACGNCSGNKIDKYAKFGLTPVAASRVSAPLVAECFANFECKLKDSSMAKKYNLFILEVVKAWIDPGKTLPKTIHHLVADKFMVAGRTISVQSKTI